MPQNGNETDFSVNMMVRYELPRNWIAYNKVAIFDALMGANSARLALTEMPYQRSWADDLQKVQLGREVAGTSRIEGAEFTEKELDAAMRENPQQLETRSQKQAAAAVSAYRWIAKPESDRPLDLALVLEVHRRLVTGCDDDHCPPGRLRGKDQNVIFGTPRHRGCEGGEEREKAVAALVEAGRNVFREHDPLIQALALHYHFAAMHPFLDGNGRCDRRACVAGAIGASHLDPIGMADADHGDGIFPPSEGDAEGQGSRLSLDLMRFRR
jgi:Fic family protein